VFLKCVASKLGYVFKQGSLRGNFNLLLQNFAARNDIILVRMQSRKRNNINNY